MGRTRVLAALTVAVLATALAGCSAAAEPEPTPSPTASVTPPAVDSLTDPACLVGDWDASQAQIEAFYADANESFAKAVTFDPTGTASLTMTADTFAWAPAMTLDADLLGTPAVVTLAGEITGEYTAAGRTITTANDLTTGLEATITIDGVAADPTPVTDEIAESPLTNATFKCTSETLVLTSAIGLGSATLELARR